MGYIFTPRPVNCGLRICNRAVFIHYAAYGARGSAARKGVLGVAAVSCGSSAVFSLAFFELKRKRCDFCAQQATMRAATAVFSSLRKKARTERVFFFIRVDTTPAAGLITVFCL